MSGCTEIDTNGDVTHRWRWLATDSSSAAKSAASLRNNCSCSCNCTPQRAACNHVCTPFAGSSHSPSLQPPSTHHTVYETAPFHSCEHINGIYTGNEHQLMAYLPNIPAKSTTIPTQQNRPIFDRTPHPASARSHSLDGAIQLLNESSNCCGLHEWADDG